MIGVFVKLADKEGTYEVLSEPFIYSTNARVVMVVHTTTNDISIVNVRAVKKRVL